MPEPSSLPQGLFTLVVLPPYFMGGLVVCLDDEEREREHLPALDGNLKTRWDDEFPPYKQRLDTLVFSGDVAGFKAFAEQHQNYFGREYRKIRDLSDDLCRCLLQAIAEERMRYEAEQMMPMQQSGKRHEA